MHMTPWNFEACWESEHGERFFWKERTPVFRKTWLNPQMRCTDLYAPSFYTTQHVFHYHRCDIWRSYSYCVRHTLYRLYVPRWIGDSTSCDDIHEMVMRVDSSIKCVHIQLWLSQDTIWHRSWIRRDDFLQNISPKQSCSDWIIYWNMQYTQYVSMSKSIYHDILIHPASHLPSFLVDSLPKRQMHHAVLPEVLSCSMAPRYLMTSWCYPRTPRGWSYNVTLWSQAGNRLAQKGVKICEDVKRKEVITLKENDWKI